MFQHIVELTINILANSEIRNFWDFNSFEYEVIKAFKTSLNFFTQNNLNIINKNI